MLFSFTDARLSTLETYETVGFDNYLYLLQEPEWWRAVQNTLVFAGASVAIETVLGIVIALALNAHFAGRGLLRAAVLIPWAIPTVVSAKMWGWMYHDLYGVINAVFLGLGVIDQAKAWTADPQLVMAALIAVDVWKTTPFMALLTLAALQIIPNELYEAARVDGVGPLRGFFYITLPLIWPALMVASDLPNARCSARVRSALRAHRNKSGYSDDVGLCAPAARRFSGCRALGRRPRRSCSW